MGRVAQLDALRGVAALSVVLGHLYLAYNGSETGWVYRTAFSPFVSGAMAVVLFFVLSGFVLTLPYAAGKQRSYPAFAVGRLIRLYPPVLTVVLASAALGCLIHGMPSPDDVRRSFRIWDEPVSWSNFATHLLAMGYPIDSIRLDPPVWSLIVEIRASLAFPLLLLIVIRFGVSSVVAFAVGSLLCIYAKSYIDNNSPVVSSSFGASLLLTGRYLVFFTMGIALALHIDTIKSVYNRIPRLGHAVLITASFILASLVGYLSKTSSSLAYLLYGVLASYIIMICVSSPLATRLLQPRAVRWLGNISFSLYLSHWPVLALVLYLTNGVVPLAAAVVLALPLILVVAQAMEAWVERPTHRAAKWAARTIDQRRLRTVGVASD